MKVMDPNQEGGRLLICPPYTHTGLLVFSSFLAPERIQHAQGERQPLDTKIL